eukprot:8625309-Pyramimonas_sp.AAC.1
MEQLRLEADPQARARQKSSALQKLRVPLPGTTSTLAAVQQEDGSITADPAEMAATLCRHWRQVFSSKPIDGVLGT